LSESEEIMKNNKQKKYYTKVERKFVGEATPIQAILPIVMEDIRKKMEEQRRFEKDNNLK